MSLNFVSIDIELAASKWDTICSVSLIRVKDGSIVDEYSVLINPECEFSHINSRIHGITQEKVVDAPIFSDVAERIVHFIGDDILIAHNVSFDGNVLQRTFKRYEVPLPKTNLFCTLVCAKQLHPEFDNFKLPALCKFYEIELSQHHDSMGDARACAELMLAIAHELKADSIHTISDALEIRIGCMDSESVHLPSAPNAAELAARAEAEKAALKLAREKEAAELRAQREREREARRLQKEMEAAEKAKVKAERAARKAAELAEKEKNPSKTAKRPILQMLDDGTIIKTYESIAAAVKETGINSKSIRSAANGVQKHAGDYCWKYVDQMEA